MTSSVEISAFPLNHAVTIFWLTAHVLRLRERQKGRVFSNSTTFNTLKNKRFHTVCLLRWKRKNACTIFTEQNQMIAIQVPCLFFLKLSALCAHEFTSAVQIVQRAQTVFRHLNSPSLQIIYNSHHSTLPVLRY